MKSFESRSPVKVAIVGIVVLVLGVIAAYNTSRLPFLNSSTTYRAEFSNAAGLRSGNPVKIAGVVVGRVSGVELDGAQVEVEFRIDDAWVGDASTASVQLNTLLGQRYLAIDPQGESELAADGVIPLERTQTPFDIVPALNQLSATVGQIDTDQLAASLDTLADTFEGTPGTVGAALDGLSRLSETISTRNAQLSQLLQRASTVTGTLAERDVEISRLLTDINPLLAELQKRRDAIRSLLEGTQDLSVQLRGLVQDNRATLRPALDDLARVADVLDRNRAELDDGIAAIRTYVHLFTNAVGTGRWFDAYVCGLAPPPVGPINDGGCEAS
ncbi:MCE family protein [Nocardioides sp.]|uniref:MCE family protein n=1 Tax=Nocardioides sp. TaxID=35761 RepID=UPI003519B2F4